MPGTRHRLLLSFAGEQQMSVLLEVLNLALVLLGLLQGGERAKVAALAG